MTSNAKGNRPHFRAGDEVVLVDGTYPGTQGSFLRLRPDENWAEILQHNGITRCHPVIWLAHATAAPRTISIGRAA